MEKPPGRWAAVVLLADGFLSSVGVNPSVDQVGDLLHEVMVIDGQTVLTGSFNFTKAAEENNAENLLVIQDTQLAAKYTANWKAHREHAAEYVSPGGGELPSTSRRRR